MDRLDSATRSRLMSRVRSSGTKTTEWRFRGLLVQAAIRGWRIGHRCGLPGNPDVVFHRARLAVFLDGCFWHGCERCRTIPATNSQFWLAKIRKNKHRDQRAVMKLRADGWKVLRIWEHELRYDPRGVLARVVQSRSRRAS